MKLSACSSIIQGGGKRRLAGMVTVLHKGAVDKPLRQWIVETRRLICVDSPTGSYMDYWHKSFKYPITPKHGPMPQMFSLIDARGAFLELPQGFLRRPHRLRAGQALLTASQTGTLIDIQWAFDTIVGIAPGNVEIGGAALLALSR